MNIFLSFIRFLFIHLCLYLHHSPENYLDYHILDNLGHGSKCLDIMGLDILGLDIVGITRAPCGLIAHEKFGVGLGTQARLLFDCASVQIGGSS